MMSRACSSAAALIFQRHLRNVTDPLSGFFMVRRDAVEIERLRPQGFKILLEILVRTPGLRVCEVPFRFGERHSGETKASSREAMRFLTQLASLRLGDLPVRFSRFGMVGATGLAVNMVLIAILTDVVGMYYVAGAVLATQGSTLWNFCLTELWVFHDRKHRRSGSSRMAMFFAVNNAALLLRVPLLFSLTTGLGVNYLISNFLSLVCLTVVRYALADTWIWAGSERDGAMVCYDIHGIVTVASEVALPELERFKVDELLDEPRILVRIGDVKPGAQNGFDGGWTKDGLAGVISEGVAADELAGLAPKNGNGHTATAPIDPDGGIEPPAWAGNGNGNGHIAHTSGNGNGHVAHANGNGHAPLANGDAAQHAIHYAETFGRYGFAVEIEDKNGRWEIMASPLVGRSPHVLYTNVVEPVLRWTIAETGHALVHAACYADGENAYMITARTDTGKTTTMLKILDASPHHSFVSDDLTIVCPDGRVLAYPKPLTISRHTVQAVSAPLLSRAERMGLLIQSRLHSRSGRRFALLIAKLRIPAATLNAVTQIVVPPPKYHVDRLVPEAKVAPEAKLTALAIIQRGGVGDVKLEHEEAMDILLSNCEDAYGFPPYPNIERFLHSRNGSDLKQVERDIITRAFANVPATLVRSETMDWWQRVPAVVNGNGTAASEKDELSALGR
jgi:putative flippase GtrA